MKRYQTRDQSINWLQRLAALKLAKESNGQIAKNHYVLAGNWNRGGLCGLTDSNSFSVLGAPGSGVLIQFADVCAECKHNFSGTVIITPIKTQ